MLSLRLKSHSIAKAQSVKHWIMEDVWTNVVSFEDLGMSKNQFQAGAFTQQNSLAGLLRVRVMDKQPAKYDLSPKIHTRRRTISSKEV